MASLATKTTMAHQLCHALTRHDPKTYLARLVELTLLKLRESYGVTGQLVAIIKLKDNCGQPNVVFASFSRSAHAILIG